MPRGGTRPNAGRKPGPDGFIRRQFSLSNRHQALLIDFQHKHNLESMSAAMRLLIERSSVAAVRAELAQPETQEALDYLEQSEKKDADG